MSQIYGVDASQPVTPLMVRDAIIECFYSAHCADTGVGEDEPDVNRSYCKTLVEKGFRSTGGNFDDPTKEDIVKVVSQLKEFSAGFRDPSIIEKHAGQIMELVEKL